MSEATRYKATKQAFCDKGILTAVEASSVVLSAMDRTPSHVGLALVLGSRFASFSSCLAGDEGENVEMVIGDEGAFLDDDGDDLEDDLDGLSDEDEAG